jgi:hypothetical protein
LHEVELYVLCVIFSLHLQVYKGITKFKDGPLQNEEEKTIMFEDIRNTGDDHWAPSSGTTPQSPEGEPRIESDEKDGDYDGNEGSDDCEEVTPPSANRKRPAPPSRKDKGKQPKTVGGHWVQDQLSKFVTMTEWNTTSCESLARKEDNSGCSIKEVMALVKESGAIPGIVQYFIASQVFTKRSEREMFITLDTPEERFAWLTMKHKWITRNDV